MTCPEMVGSRWRFAQHFRGSVLQLTERDIQILEALTLRIRAFSTDQLGRTWWSSTAAPGQNARKRMLQLAEIGLAEGYHILAHPELVLDAPACSWQPGLPTPDFGALSYRVQSRWTESPVQTAVFGATRKAGNKFGGGGGRRPKAVETTHDLHMSQVFLYYQKHHPERARNWQSEFEIDRRRTKKHGQKLPDAMIISEDEKHVVDFGGAYSKKKLESLHLWCERNQLSYEIW